MTPRDDLPIFPAAHGARLRDACSRSSATSRREAPPASRRAPHHHRTGGDPPREARRNRPAPRRHAFLSPMRKGSQLGGGGLAEGRSTVGCPRSLAARKTSRARVSGLPLVVPRVRRRHVEAILKRPQKDTMSAAIGQRLPLGPQTRASGVRGHRTHKAPNALPDRFDLIALEPGDTSRRSRSSRAATLGEVALLASNAASAPEVVRDPVVA